jgi:ribosomal protein L29
MAMKMRDLKRMSKEERQGKLQELKMELIKSKTASQKSSAKIKEIKKMIARILTLNK